MASSSACPSAASTPSWKYDVFLSFRGDSTRRNFTDHLHTELKRFGIITSIDDQLRRRGQISPALLLQAIEDSRCSVIIFSQNYASSSWCLDELSKILECVRKGKHTAFPVFYGVDPSHVRKQTGSYAEAFKKHEKAYNTEKVVKWREALTKASYISGWDARDRYQYEVIKEIVSKIFNEIHGNPSSSNIEPMVGMDSRIKNVLSLLCLESLNVRMVGIWGMPGIGKTTIAQAIYQRLIHTKHQFQGCFLSNVREKSLRNENLQMELLSQILRKKNPDDRIVNSGPDSIRKALHSKKVLIVLDDVDNIKQLDELVGHRDWFGPKSRIIITTRDKSLLIEKQVDAIHEAKELHKDDALELFCRHAFKHEPPGEDFGELFGCILDYTHGNPLALKILGSFLYKRSINEWESELKKIMITPNEVVQQVFRVSFDGLSDYEKNKFLDIACFFKGEDKDRVSEILDSCNFSATGISVLKEKALITISEDNKLCMHDLIQKMGWEIVRQQSIEDPGKQSRLWLTEDIRDVLTRNSGTEALQGITLNLLSTSKELDFNVDVFTKMINLRVLEFRVMPRCSLGGKELSSPYKMHLKGDFKFPSNNLRYLKWEGYPLKSLPLKFYPRYLFELDMRFSKLEQLWKGNKPFLYLRYMDLRHSKDLIRTPDLSGAPELRVINFEGCTSLVEVHPTIGTLNMLSFLNMKNCLELVEVAKSFRKLTSIVSVDFSGCSKLEKLPKGIGELTFLKTLNLSGCTKLNKPLDELLTSSEAISRKGCKGGDLTLSSPLPSELGSLCSLEYLDLSGNSFVTLPSLTPLTELHTLKLKSCKSLMALTKLPFSIEKVLASDCESLETFSHPPNSYARSSQFDFSNCGRLAENEESVSLKAILHGIRAIHPLDSYMFSGEKKFSALVAGSRIPEWFIHRSVGNSIILKLPPDFHDLDSLGLGYCAVLCEENLSRWHFDHIWLGFSYLQTSLERVSDHLKISFDGYNGKAPLVVKELGIRLLSCARKRLLDNNVEEFETLNATVFSPSPQYDEECCWTTTTEETYCVDECWCELSEECMAEEHTSGLRIKIEGYKIYVPKCIMALAEYPNQYEVFSEELCGENDLATNSSNERLELGIKEEDDHHKFLTPKPFNHVPVEVPAPEDETAIDRSLEVLDIPEQLSSLSHLLDLLLSSLSPRQGAWLPSRLSLSTLKELNLSDCNLQEGAPPSEISSLCSLEHLDLSRNNFITLPSLTRLIRLHELKLEHCKRLRSLTELPSSIRTLMAQNCKALETFSHPPNSYAMWKSGELELDFFNCPRLLENEGGVSLEAILWGIRISAPSPPSWSLSKARRNYNAVAVGSSIPEWFIHQSMGNSITVKLPPDFGDARSMGLAFCAVLGKNTQKNSHLISHFENFKPLLKPVHMHRLNHDHIWFGYASLPEIWSPEECGYYRSAFLGSILASEDNIDIDEEDMDNFWCHVHPNIDHLKVSFTSGDDGVSPVVKNCGVHLLYEPKWREEMKNLLHNREVIEYDTVDAISCPRTLFFEDERCWEENLEVGHASARFGLEIEVEGYHKKIARTPKPLAAKLDPVTRLRESFWKRKRARLAQVAIPVDAALMKKKLVSTSDDDGETTAPESLPRPVQAPSLDEVQDNLKQHPCIPVTQSGLSSRPNIPPTLPRTSSEQTLLIPTVQPDAAVSPILTLQNLASDHASQLIIAGLMARMGEVSRLEAELNLMSRERACLKEELDRALDLATSSQEEADERVRKLALNNKALQAKVDQLVAERNALATEHGEVSAERDDQAGDD